MSETPPIWHRHGRPLTELADAWTVLAANAAPLPIESVSLDRAEGRVLAQAIPCKGDFPPFDKAMMDGFAVRSADCAAPNASLTLIGTAAAGHVDIAALRPGQAVRINTGAPMPSGADAVARIEDATVSQDGTRVSLAKPVRSGMHVSPRGSAQRAGDVAVAAPTRIGPAQVATIAAAGHTNATVFEQADVAIVSTGDELVPPGASTKPGQIVESNSILIAGLVRRFGATARPLGIVEDRPDALRERFAAALQSRVVITCGGMSMGTLDLVPQTLESLGVRWLFHGVNMRPAKPVAYGRGPAGQHVFGLPGNPGSTFVAMHVLVRPLLDALHGLGGGPPRWRAARLIEEIAPHKDSRPAVLPGLMHDGDDGVMEVRLMAWGGSGDAIGLASAEALIFIPHPAEGLRAGEAVTYLTLD
ncbi:MAG: molybdopterin molybdenumtransferase MoeA [Phycisphaerae bacterium]|nr:MAG: molybdopterin molybdotransferase MoeA [Planctomycetia bacterium]RIK70613.1 MAG: molybdopterin molybdenumtransferase MoeA [Planctomycetota bacterium]GJQ26296.1 MAG: molybdopterin molybdenumtransferase MoeA [Phycisphaerae bacterium]